MRELDANTLMFFDQHMDALPLYQAFEELLFNSFPLVIIPRYQRMRTSALSAAEPPFSSS